MNRIYYQGSFKLATDWPREPNICEQDVQFDCLKSIGCACADLVKAYNLAIASAMENGVRFEDQEKAKNIAWNFPGNKRWGDGDGECFRDWQPKEGDNWPAPEGAEIGWQQKINDRWVNISEGAYDYWNSDGQHPHYRKVAVLRSESVKNSAHSYTEGMDTESGESVEKKESPDYGKEPKTDKEKEDRQKLEEFAMPLVRTGFELALLEIESCINELSYFRGTEIIKERIQELRNTKQKFDYNIFKKEQSIADRLNQSTPKE